MPGNSLHWGNHVGVPGVNRTARHAVKFGGGWFLDKNHARLFLDGAQAQRAVRAHTRKDHTDTSLQLVICQCAEEEINWQTQAARRYRVENV